MVDCGTCGSANAAGARFCSSCGAALGAGPSRQTRRTVTVLFADMVGSTSLGERLDAEVLRTVQARYFAALRDTIERHGGTVEKFIGDAVMAVFGIPTLHEDDALRAVRAAVDLAPALQPLNADLASRGETAIELRVGIQTGEVVADEATGGDSLATGDTLNTAARLEQVAKPGEIVIGRTTYLLVRDAVSADAIDDLVLRGKRSAVAAYRVAGLAGRASQVPRAEIPIVGRADELGILHRALEAARDSRTPRLVTILAPAGVGKSRLARQFAAEVAKDVRVLRGRCLPYGDGITYWAIGEILRSAAGITDDDTVEAASSRLAALAGEGPESGRIERVLAALLGLEPREVSADDIAWAVRRSLELLARSIPLVVIVEDIHWAEPELLDVLELTAAWADGPLLILCPARPELLEARSRWATDVPNAEVISLQPLTGTDGDRLIDVQPGGSALTPEVRARIAAAAEGNPLFVEEMIAKLVDDGRLVRDDGGWRALGDLADVDVPLTITALLAARIDSLESGERAAAERASVVGRTFDRGAVTELSAEPDRGTVAARLLALTRKELIRPDGRGIDGDDAFRFRHVLIRDAAYDRLTKADRAQLHERFAAWLEQMARTRAAEYLEIVAHHYASAAEYANELGQLRPELAAAAIDHLIRAAEKARALHAHRDVVRLLERAAALPWVPLANPSRARILEDAAESAGLAGSLDQAIALGERALVAADQDGDDDLLRARIHERTARWRWDRGEWKMAKDELETAEALAGRDSRSVERARILAARARMLMLSESADAIAAAGEAAEIAREVGAPGVEAGALTTLGTAIANAGDPDEGLVRLAAARVLAESSEDGYELGRALINITYVLDLAGRFAESQQLALEWIGVLDRLGLDRGIAAALRLNFADGYLWSGDPERVQALARDLLSMGLEGNAIAMARTVSAAALVQQGALDEASAMLDSIDVTSLPPDSAFLYQDYQLLRAQIGAERGNEAAVSEAIAAVLESDHAGPHREYPPRLLEIGIRVQADRAYGARETDDAPTLDEALVTGRAYADRLAAFAAESSEPGVAPLHWRGRIALEVAMGEIERLEGRPGLDVWQHAIDETVTWHARPTEAYARWRLAEATISAGATAAEIEEAYRLARTVAADAHQAIVEQRLIELGRTAGLVLRAPEPLVPKSH